MVSRVYVGLLGALTAPLVVAALAWACVPQGQVAASPASVPTGSAASVAVTAGGFPIGATVEVRWNGISGPLLATGVGPSFTVSVTVPDVPPGVYMITAAVTDPSHAAHSLATTAFEVTDPNAVPPPADPVAPPADPVPPPAPLIAPADPLVAPAVLVPMNPFAAAPPATGENIITGTDGPDRLVGTPGRDVITCKGGNDVVLAKGGDDVINCGAGADRVDGGAGDDVIRGGGGNDVLIGGTGDDTIFGAGGNDRLNGGGGADRLSGGIGLDVLRGDAGPDRLAGDAGRDVLHADSSDRVLRGLGDRVLR